MIIIQLDKSPSERNNTVGVPDTAPGVCVAVKGVGVGGVRTNPFVEEGIAE